MEFVIVSFPASQFCNRRHDRRNASTSSGICMKMCSIRPKVRGPAVGDNTGFNGTEAGIFIRFAQHTNQKQGDSVYASYPVPFLNHHTPRNRPVTAQNPLPHHGSLDRLVHDELSALLSPEQSRDLGGDLVFHQPRRLSSVVISVHVPSAPGERGVDT